MLFILSSTSLVQNSSVYCSPATLPSSLLGNEVHWETGFGLPIGRSGVHSDSLVPLPKIFTHEELELLDSEGDNGHVITTSQQEGMAKDEQSYDHPPLS